MIHPEWPAPDAVRSITTTRQGGVSTGVWASLNLADHVGDDPRAVQENRQALRNTLELPAEPAWLQQVHGNDVVDAVALAADPTEADASVVRGPGRVSAVLTADCLPALFCDRAGSCVAAAHAGWRGLAAGILENTVQAMAVDPADLLVWLGPAIGPQAFEVGDEVRMAFIEQHPQTAQAFTPGERGRGWQADLYQLARIRLATVGVRAVYGGDRCTFTEKSDFYSYRRDGTTGRMATLIWLR